MPSFVRNGFGKPEFSQFNTRFHQPTLFYLTVNCCERKKRLLINDPRVLQSQIDTLIQEVQSMKTKQTSLELEVQTLRTQLTDLDSLKSQRGSLYTVWGRRTCPLINGTETIYTGLVGGGLYSESGNGVSYLCLPHQPDSIPGDYKFTLTGSDRVAHLYGSEYEFTFKKIAKNDDAPCAICNVASVSLSLMIPAKKSCPVDWTKQYSGVLCSSFHGHYRNDYACVYGDPEYATDGARQYDNDGILFYPVRTVCGSLPCPPYQNSQFVTCVVCTK